LGWTHHQRIGNAVHADGRHHENCQTGYCAGSKCSIGVPVSTLSGIGLVLIACTVIYVIPRTSVLGAILLTGYLGGAIASNVRAGSGWFETVFPVLFGALIWGGLWLRDHRLKNLLPLASEAGLSAGARPEA
jgi:hypothetical protein